MQKFIVVTVENAPYIVPFNDGVHHLWVTKSDDDPTILEVRTEGGNYTVQKLYVKESPDEILRLMDLARELYPYYLAYIDLSRVDFGDERAAFDTTMDELGFMTYAIGFENKRIELPQGVYLFDNTLPRNSRLKYTLGEARTHIQDAITDLTGNVQYFASDYTDRPLLTIAGTQNAAWG